MVNNLIENFKKQLIKSNINDLEGNYKYSIRKRYLNGNEYDELTFIIKIFLKEDIFKESYSVKIIVNSFDYKIKLYDHYSNKFIKDYNINEIKQILIDVYRYLTTKKLKNENVLYNKAI